jgi:hypothetical protein
MKPDHLTLVAANGRRVQPPLSERALLAAVVACAGSSGWECFHSWFSDRRGAPGAPDLLLCRPGRLLAVVLKRDHARPSPAQQDWLDRLAACGAEVYVWRPANWSSGDIERALSPGATADAREGISDDR